MEPAPEARDAILDAAERLFSDRGYAATTTKALGREAGVNAALLYYYFDGKHSLYHAVLERVFTRLAQQLRGGLEGAASPTEAVAALVGAQVELMSRRPTIPALLVREMIDHQGAHASDAINRIVAGNFRMFCDLIRAGQRTGEFRDDLTAELAAISTIAQVAYLFIAAPAIRLLLKQEGNRYSPDFVRQFARHAAAFALGALGATSASARFAAEVRE
jgi:AcrR family transcriptional regulator